MSMPARMLSATLLLAGLLAVMLVIVAVPALNDAQKARSRQQLNLASGTLVEAAAALAQERGLMNGLLAAAGQPGSAARSAVVEVRARADAALARGLAVLPDGAGPPLTAALDRLAGMRRAAEQRLAGGDGPTAAAWFAAATDTIDAVVVRRRGIDAIATAEAPAMRLVLLRDRLAEMSEFAGRLRGMLNGLISRGGPASGDEVQAIGALVGRIDGAWADIDARLVGYPDATRDDVRAAFRTWTDGFGPARTAVLEAAAQGTEWPLRAPVWFRQSTAAIDALLDAQSRAGAALDAALEHDRVRAEGTMWAVGVSVLLALAVVPAALWRGRRTVPGVAR